MNRIFWEMPKAVLTIMVIWSGAFTLLWPLGWGDLALRILIAMGGMVAAWLVGLFLWKVYAFGLYRDKIIERIEQVDCKRAVKGVRVSLFDSTDLDNAEQFNPPIQISYNPLPRRKVPKALVNRWPGFEAYRRRHPEHAKVYIAILEVLMAHYYLPATHHEKGHAGLTLLEHSLNVVRVMERTAKAFRYYGVMDDKRRVIMPVQDDENCERGYYRFSPDDPLLPLAALAHDIGKLETYSAKPPRVGAAQRMLRRFYDPLGKDGTLPAPVAAKRIRADHDVIGKRVLLRIPEVFDLSQEDRNDLLIAVGYHHHWQFGAHIEGHYLMPLPYSNELRDRQHALAALTSFVDLQTGYLEGGKKPLPLPVPAHLSQKPSTPSTSGAPPSTSDAPHQPTGRSEPVNPPADGSHPTAAPRPERSQPTAPAANGHTGAAMPAVMVWFLEMATEFAAEKGSSKANEQSGWLFIDEEAWLAWLYRHNKPAAERETLTIKYNDSMGSWVHPATKELLGVLNEIGALPDQELYQNATPLFDIFVERNDGREPDVRKRVLVVKERALPKPARLKPTKRKLKLAGPSCSPEKGEGGHVAANEPRQQPAQAPHVETMPTAAPQSEPAEQQMQPEQQLEQQPEQPKQSPSQENVQEVDPQQLALHRAMFAEWVEQIQNLERLDEQEPFQEKKVNGKWYALIDPAAIPEKYHPYMRYFNDGDFVFPRDNMVYARFERRTRKA